MAKTDVYQPIPALYVEGFTLDTIQGVPATLSHAPFHQGHIPQFSLVSVNDTDKSFSENGYTILDSQLRKVSLLHGRSYELTFGEQNSVIWEDAYGNIFGGLNSKGNNLDTPIIEQDRISPTGYRVHGMQDSNSMIRMLRASEVLRSHHIDTEAMVKIIEPAELPYAGNLLPLSDFKKTLIAAVWDRQNIPREELPQISKALADTTLYITIRGIQVPERMADLAEIKDYASLLPMLKSTFRYVNFAEKQHAKKDPSYIPESFSLQKKEDVTRYFNEYLPKKIAKNYATMHKLGLIHYYPHSGNISTVGSIYDLDSVRGELLGLEDTATTTKDSVDDVSKVINGNSSFPRLNDIVGKITGEGDTFRVNFFKTYFSEMGWEGDISRFEDIEGIITATSSASNDTLLSYYQDKIIESQNLQIDFEIENMMNQAVSLLSESEHNEDIGTLEDIYIPLEPYLRETLEWYIINKITDNGYRDDFSPAVSALINRFVEQQTESFKEAVNMLLASTPEHPLHRYIHSATGVVAEAIEYLAKQTIVRHSSAEANIAKNAIELMDIFNNFEGPIPKHFVYYYLELFTQQTGIDFVLPDTREELITKWHMHDQQKIEKVVENALKNTQEHKHIEAAVFHAFGSNENDQDYRWDPINRYVLFAIDHIIERFEELYPEQLTYLRTTYGEGAMQAILQMFARKYEELHINELSEETRREDIEESASERISSFFAKYLPTVDGKPKFWYTAKEIAQQTGITTENIEMLLVLESQSWSEEKHIQSKQATEGNTTIHYNIVDIYRLLERRLEMTLGEIFESNGNDKIADLVATGS